jgi:hypothetical protein
MKVEDGVLLLLLTVAGLAIVVLLWLVALVSP